MKVKVEKLDNLGQGIAHINDKVCFIKNALPDEVVDIKIISDRKNYQKAQIKELIEPSQNRKTNICPFSDLCGGCSLGHLKHEKSLEYKCHKLKEIILKSTHQEFEPTIIKSDKEYNYRNKITLKIVDSKWGYYNSESHNFVNINKCLLAKECINKVIEKQNLFNISSGEIVLRANNLDEILICIKTNEEYQIRYDELNNLNIVGIVINDEIKIGKNYFYHTINNLKYKITYNSFFQINDYICSEIFKILNNLNLGISVLDLYCGVGSLSLSIANKVNKIYGIEIIENAIHDANINVNLNNINNTKYLVGKVEDNIKFINDKIDTIIVDPPRKGLSNIEEITNFKAQNLVYISCDPVTLGRDLKELTKFYEIKKVYALDMFPNTYHVESLIILNKK